MYLDTGCVFPCRCFTFFLCVFEVPTGLFSVKMALKTAQAEAGLSTTACTLKQDLSLRKNCGS